MWEGPLNTIQSQANESRAGVRAVVTDGGVESHQGGRGLSNGPFCVARVTLHPNRGAYWHYGTPD